MCPSLSVIKPFRVSYPSSGNSIPSFSPTSDNRASPSQIKVSSPCIRIMTSSSSNSSRMLPTISSRISSMQTIPAVWPYSSTTITMWIFFCCMDLKSRSIFRVSGMKWASFIIPSNSFKGLLRFSLLTLAFITSLKWMMPMILSMLSS